jgi:hypothetical protein
MKVEEYKQTGKKAGIIGLATLGTYLGVGSLEEAASGGVANAIDFFQTVSSMAVPYIMANRYMRGRGDSSLISYATKIVPMLFLPEALGDLDFIFGEAYSNAISNNKVYLSAFGAAIPFVEGARNVLREGY